jgi:TolA-binding protein
MTSACPPPVELERAFWSGDAQLSEHARTCPRCEGAWDEIAKLAQLGEALGPAPLAGDRREELRATILSKLERPAVAPARSRWPLFAFPLAAAAAALLVWWLASPTPPSRTIASDRRSTVLDHPGTRYLVASVQPDEIVRLVDGQLSLHVATLPARERFRVIAGDAEIESRGGAFDVSARGDALLSVRAISGTVEVRASRETRTLRAGETWILPPPAAAAAAAPAPAAAAAPAPAPAHPSPVSRLPSPASRLPSPASRLPSPVSRLPSPPSRLPVSATETETQTQTETPTQTETATSPTPAMLAFDDAWRAMRASDFRAAAAAFDRAALADETGPLAEDARFWRAAALARANRAADAIAAFTAFLDRHPRAVRAGEASAMLGWLLLERGHTADLDRAAELFTAATRDTSPRVRDSAARGLRAVGAAASR